MSSPSLLRRPLRMFLEIGYFFPIMNFSSILITFFSAINSKLIVIFLKITKYSCYPSFTEAKCSKLSIVSFCNIKHHKACISKPWLGNSLICIIYWIISGGKDDIILRHPLLNRSCSWLRYHGNWFVLPVPLTTLQRCHFDFWLVELLYPLTQWQDKWHGKSFSVGLHCSMDYSMMIVGS